MKIKAPLLRDAKVWFNNEKNKYFAEIVLDHETKDGSYPRVILSDRLAQKLDGKPKGEVLEILMEKVGDDYYGLEVELAGEKSQVRPLNKISKKHLTEVNKKRYRAKDGIVWIKEDCQGDEFLIPKRAENCLFTNEWGFETKVQFIFEHVGISFYADFKKMLDGKYPDKSSSAYREGFKKMVDHVVKKGADSLEVKVFEIREILGEF